MSLKNLSSILLTKIPMANFFFFFAMNQKLFISQRTPRPEYTYQKWSFKKSTELFGLYEYIFSCRDNDGVFDVSVNLPTDLSV